MDNNSIVNNRLGLIKLAIYILLLAGIYFSTFSWLVNKDWTRGDYSYGVLIPFIVLYLLWEKKDRFFSESSEPTWYGFILFLPGIMLFWVGKLAGEFFILYFSCWLIIAGLCWINFGMEKIKVIAFPLFFSLTMFPLPNFINVKITLKLKLISSKFGVILMRMWGMSAFREGNVIDLGFTKLQVVDACSGLRYLFSMIVLSILIAYFYRGRLWKKLTVIISSVPLTIFSNSLRIALTGILAEKFGQKMITGFFHEFEGLLIFMITLGTMLLEIWIMDRLFPEVQLKIKHMYLNDDPFSIEKPENENAGKTGRLNRPASGLSVFFASIILLCTTFALAHGVSFRKDIPMKQSFCNFPMKIGKWKGVKLSMEQRFIDVLDFTDYVMADYQDNSGKVVNFYAAYYKSQQKGASIHSPATCLRGGGWRFTRAGRAELSLSSGKTMPVNRAVIEKGSIRQICYYWFPSRGRILTNAYEMKFFNFWDALTRHRTDGALIRVITLVYPDEDVKTAENRMHRFIKELIPVLKQFLPE